MKIVVDTNVMISGIFWKGPPHKILKLWTNGKIKIFTTKKILNEYFQILDRIDKPGETAKKWQLLIAENVKIIEAKETIKICRDSHDDMFINCALTANAPYLVSGDKDLLTLKKISKTKILTPSEFIKVWHKK